MKSVMIFFFSCIFIWHVSISGLSYVKITIMLLFQFHAHLFHISTFLNWYNNYNIIIILTWDTIFSFVIAPGAESWLCWKRPGLKLVPVWITVAGHIDDLERTEHRQSTVPLGFWRCNKKKIIIHWIMIIIAIMQFWVSNMYRERKYNWWHVK